MAGERVTTGEVYATLQEFKESVAQSFTELNRRLDTIAAVHPDVYAADKLTEAERIKSLHGRIAALESARTWLTRAVGGQLVTALMAVLYLGGK